MKTIMEKKKRKREKNFAYWYNRGELSLSNEKFKKAVKSYDKALEINPNHCSECWYKRGLALRGGGDFGDAILSYDKALAINPTMYQVWYDRGIDLQLLHRFQDAILSYDKALHGREDIYHEAWSRRGDVLCLLGRVEDAIASYDRALEISPNEYLYWILKSKALELLGWQKASRECRNKAIEINPALKNPSEWTGLVLYAGQTFVAKHPLEGDVVHLG